MRLGVFAAMLTVLGACHISIRAGTDPVATPNEERSTPAYQPRTACASAQQSQCNQYRGTPDAWNECLAALDRRCENGDEKKAAAAQAAQEREAAQRREEAAFEADFQRTQSTPPSGGAQASPTGTQASPTGTAEAPEPAPIVIAPDPETEKRKAGASLRRRLADEVDADMVEHGTWSFEEISTAGNYDEELVIEDATCSRVTLHKLVKALRKRLLSRGFTEVDCVGSVYEWSEPLQ